MYKKQIGDLGEKLAADYIKEKGYKIIKMNYRCPFGEIDIIAKYKDYYVFIEVKSRSGNTYGNPIESITKTKIKHILKTIGFFVNEYRIYDTNIRIDAIEVYIYNGKKISINHIENIYN